MAGSHHSQRDSRDDDSGDSEDGPEQLTLSSAKKTSQTRVEAVRAFERGMKEKRKRERRERQEERQRVLEERRAVGEEEDVRRKRVRRNTGRGEKPDLEPDLEQEQDLEPSREKDLERVQEKKTMEMEDVERRMERAMRDAAAEISDNDEEKDKSEDADTDMSGYEDDVFSSSDVDDDGQDNENPAEEWGGIAEEAPTTPKLAELNHLPDHFFAAAAATTHSTDSTSKHASKSTSSSFKQHKYKRKQSKAKEVLVGSRAIRTLPLPPPSTTPSSHSSLTASLTLPPARINKFLKRNLNLKPNNITSLAHTPTGSRDNSPQKKTTKSKRKSWERRPVHLGVMRHKAGPAMRFVRNASVAGH